MRYTTTKLFVLIILMVAGYDISGQSLRFEKYQVNETGFYCYFPKDPGQFQVQISEDGMNIYLGETEANGNKFGLVLVVFQGQFKNSTKQELIDLLTAYMDYLKTTFDISKAAGYGYGHTMESNSDAQGIIDYWESSTGKEFNVKGWIDQSALAFLYISGKEELNYNYTQLFMNGFRFKK
ncbi:MAG: hypothetical protein U0W24_01950 [Bacteroidales bacterium]